MEEAPEQIETWLKEIKLLCPNSKVEDGMNIVFESYSDKLVTSENDVNNWIDTL